MRKVLAVLIVAAAVSALAVQAATAGTMQVSRKQIWTSVPGYSVMEGSLEGDWYETTTEPDFRLHPSGMAQARGTELFDGCMNETVCGTLTFEYHAEIRVNEAGELIRGRCWHRVTGGTGGVRGSDGAHRLPGRPREWLLRVQGPHRPPVTAVAERGEESLHGGVSIHTLTPTEELQTFQRFTIAWSGNGKTLTSQGPASVRITYSDAAHTSIVRSELRGLLVAVTLPGRGAVYLETGLLVEAGPFPGSPVLFRHGPDGFRSDEDYEAFCSYFE